MIDKNDLEKVKKTVNLLPQENCGKCGFENCGKFAVALVEGKASPFGCHKDPSAGDAICEVLGIEVTEEMRASNETIASRGGHHGGHHAVGAGHSFHHHGHHGHAEGGKIHSHHL